MTDNIQKDDLYIDLHVSGNTIWLADNDMPQNEHLVLIERKGTETWTHLVSNLVFSGLNEFEKELQKRRRTSLLNADLVQNSDLKDVIKKELYKLIEKL